MKPAGNHTRMLPVLMILSMLLSGFISGRLSSVDSAGEGGASFAGVYLCQAQENSLLVFTGHFTLGADGTLQDDVLKLTGTWQETSPGQLHFTIAADVESAYSSDDGKGLIIQLAPGSTRPHVRDGKLHCYKTKAGEAEPAPALAPDVVLPNDPITLPLPVNKILFSSNQNTNDDIFVMNADGKDVTELTHDIANDRDPAWSVDGKKILFSSNRDGDYEIFQMNAQGTELVQITQNKFDDFSPSLSLNGKQIAFVSIRSGDSPQLYVMNADGTGEVKLTDFAGGIGSPSWSPNSQQIAFHTLQPRNMEIYVLDLESRSLTRLTDNANNNWGPAWQPNGGWIAYASGHFGSGDTEIYRVETDTEAPVPVRITYNNTDDWSPSWSADATQVVFISNRNGEPDIYRMDASGENQVQLTDTSASEAAPEMTAQNMTIQKVLHLVWNPYLPQRRAKLIDYLNYLNPATTAEKAVTSFQLYNDNRFRFLIEEQIEINAFPVHSNGFVFTEETYFECMEQGWPDTEICSGNIITDYDLIINDPELDICGRVNRGEIDEVWLDPPPYTGFAETALVGPAGFWYNGPIFTQNNCQKTIPMIGFNYSCEWDGGHVFGHRMEATMTFLYVDWIADDPHPHNWENFGMVKFQSPSFPYAGCGSVHYSPNANSAEDDYDYNVETFFPSRCDDFYNYPNLGDPTTTSVPVNCSAWNCTGLGYLDWWYRHIPSFDAIGPDGMLNNWWVYFLYPMVALQLPDPNFACNSVLGENPLEVSFFGHVDGTYHTLLWNFGDGATSNVKDPIHTFTEYGIYTVTLTAYNDAAAGTEIKVNYIQVLPVAPTADFSSDLQSGSTPLTVAFTNQSGEDYDQVLWDFGDGTGSSEENPTHTYAAYGVYTVTLTVTGPVGSDTEVKPAFIQVAPNAPVANFSSNVQSGYAPLQVDFLNQSQEDYDQVEWDFGDGANSSLENPTHVYTDTGVYTITLTVTGPAGKDTEVKAAYIQALNPPPVAAFSSDWQTGLVPLSVSFANLSTGIYDTFAWDFGDGSTSSLENPVYTYTTPGVYTVTLTTSGPSGADTEIKADYIQALHLPPLADFFSNPQSGYAPLMVTFTNLSQGEYDQVLWDFGDTVTSTLDRPNHTYTAYGVYTVTLTVTGPGGADTVTYPAAITVLAVPPPVAGFSSNRQHGVAPLSVSFTNLSTGNYATSDWDFGDGASSSQDDPVHVYTSPGVYTVTLTVGGPGGVDTETKAAYVDARYPPPVANFSSSPLSGYTPFVVTFTNLSAGVYDQVLWDFGDTLTSTLDSPTHTYTAPGIYTVTLTVIGPGGIETATHSAAVTVWAGPPPVADFSSDRQSGTAPLTVSFTNQSTGAYTTLLWDFGDGSASSQDDPIHVYTTPGTYTVTLTVSGPGGADTKTAVAYINVATLQYRIALPVVQKSSVPSIGR